MPVLEYRKKPVVIEAIQFTKDNFDECYAFVGEDALTAITSEEEGLIGIMTLEGGISARYGDYIIKGVAGEFYPCKPDIFAKTYTLSATEGLSFGTVLDALKAG